MPTCPRSASGSPPWAGSTPTACAAASTRPHASRPRDLARARDRDDRALATLVAALDTAEARLAARRAAVPRITYPAALPVTARRDDIAAAIRDHQVVIVAGETGSGKTTQIPKICLDLGRGVTGMIGHTQPRRLAARTVADRIAEELGTELGDVVGYKVRFTDQVGENTLVKLMTDGILLAELTGDRDLSRYDTLIIDEAHERSLNIDFILGYLTRLLPRRPDLKVVITSATIDTERFAAHFDAPVVEVERPLVPRRGPLPARRRPRRPRGRSGPRRDRGHRRRRRRAAARRARRRPRLPARRARDPRHRGRAGQAELPQHRDPPALRPADHRRAAPGLRGTSRQPDRARHERRRDVADRAGHPLRRRHRPRPGLPLLAAAQGAAAADREGQPGQREPARRALRPGRRRHLHPPVRRGRLRRPSRVHRPGDPAHQPRVGDPADDRAGPGRPRGVPVRRQAGPARRRRRPRAAQRARRAGARAPDS